MKKEAKKSPKFKVGDKVITNNEYIGSNYTLPNGGYCGFHTSMIVEDFIRIKDVCSGYYLCSNDYYYKEEWLLPYEEKKTMQYYFKVGDKVIINPNSRAIPDSTVAMLDNMMQAGIFTVEEITPAFHNITLDNGYTYSPKWILPVPLFKVGDIVTVRSDIDYTTNIPCSFVDGMDPYKGTKVTIENIRKTHYTPSALGEDGCKYSIIEDDGNWSWSSPMFIINNNLNLSNNENQLQREDGIVSRGIRQTECGICYRGCKATITVGYLSYKEVSGKC